MIRVLVYLVIVAVLAFGAVWFAEDETDLMARVDPVTGKVDDELEKLHTAVHLGSDTVMDLSTGGNIDGIRQAIVDASPVPSTYTGFRRSDRARSAEVTTTAPPASVTRQQSSRWSGHEIMRDASTSSTVSGSRIMARGFSCAHFRVATATSASCSLVVPNSCMCRAAASA